MLCAEFFVEGWAGSVDNRLILAEVGSGINIIFPGKEEANLKGIRHEIAEFWVG